MKKVLFIIEFIFNSLLNINSIEGKNVPASNVHYYYVVIEVIKVILLSYLGISLFKRPKDTPNNRNIDKIMNGYKELLKY
jgi:uncharacterized protein YacL